MQRPSLGCCGDICWYWTGPSQTKKKLNDTPDARLDSANQELKSAKSGDIEHHQQGEGESLERTKLARGDKLKFSADRAKGSSLSRESSSSEEASIIEEVDAQVSYTLILTPSELNMILYTKISTKLKSSSKGLRRNFLGILNSFVTPLFKWVRPPSGSIANPHDCCCSSTTTLFRDRVII